jgi:adenosylcobinamide-GDP ribazoletransferase
MISQVLLRIGVVARRDELLCAMIFLTRLPVRWRGAMPDGLLAGSVWAFPVVGVAVGLAGAGAYAAAVGLGLTPMSAAVAAVAVQAALTGGLHEDGLADVADGFGGGRDRDSRLAIMRDSRLGTYGALTVLLAVLARVAALAQLGAAGATGPAVAALVAAGALSRSAMPAVMRTLPPARTDGLGASRGRPGAAAVWIGLALAAAVALAAAGPGGGIVALAAAAVAAAGLAALARRRIGGFTGDVLGACQQAAEVAALLALAAWSGTAVS